MKGSRNGVLALVVASCLFVANAAFASPIVCGQGVTTDIPDNIAIAATPESPTTNLTPYRFLVSANVLPGDELRVADLILATKWLPGTTQALTNPEVGVKTQLTKNLDPKILMGCALALESSQLYGSAFGSDFDTQLDFLAANLMAGRYDLASVIDDISLQFAGSPADSVNKDVGLGQILFEIVKDRISKIDAKDLNKEKVVIRYTDRQRFFEYNSSTINLDVRGIRLLLAADYIYMRYGLNWLVDCLDEAADRKNVDFCQNLVRRIRAKRGSDWKGYGGSLDLPDFELSSALSLLIQSYDFDVLLLVLDEISEHMLSAAAAARSGLVGCVEVDRWTLQVRSVTGCEDANPAAIESSMMLGYTTYKLPRIVRWLRFVIAHELSHHFLAHTQQSISESKNTVLAWAKGYDWAPEAIECGSRLALEAEADLLAVALYAMRSDGEPVLDYFGNVLKKPPEVDLFAADKEPFGKRVYTAWSPFFEGYARIFERGDLCGYFGHTSRHVVFQALYFLMMAKR